MKLVPEQIARFVPDHPFVPLGTDGFGRSDTRHALRRHFHVDAENVVVATLRQLALRGELPVSVAAEAARKYAINDVNAAPVGETGGDT
jgi:pyruvate dehydrogenase E1 component